MDEDRPLLELKTKTAASKDLASLKQSSQPKSLLRNKGVEPLTPLHRLARFKEIRDRNLARDRNVRKSRYSVKPQNTLFVQPRTMEAVVNGINKKEVTATKSKTAERMSNGSETTNHTNGVEHPTNGEGLAELENVSGEEIIITVTNGEKSSPKADETLREKEVAQKSEEEPEASDAVETPDSEGDSESEPEEAGQESEGSSLDVVGGSSAESLDLQVSRQSSFDDLDDDAAVPSSSKSPEVVPEEPAPPADPPTSDFMKRLGAGGKISSRRCLRRDYVSPQLKRKLDSEDDYSDAKRIRDDGSSSSPGWKFFSPTRTLSKIWSPFKATPTKVQALLPTPEVDESMVVNVDDQSNFFDKIEDETATTLIQDSQEKPAQKWCAIM